MHMFSLNSIQCQMSKIDAHCTWEATLAAKFCLARSCIEQTRKLWPLHCWWPANEQCTIFLELDAFNAWMTSEAQTRSTCQLAEEMNGHETVARLEIGANRCRCLGTNIQLKRVTFPRLMNYDLCYSGLLSFVDEAHLFLAAFCHLHSFPLWTGPLLLCAW